MNFSLPKFQRTVIAIALLTTMMPVANSRVSQASEQTPPSPDVPSTEAYSKFEYRIPMRDGKNLFTAVYVPKDATRKYPILINRTPYSAKPYGIDKYRGTVGPSKRFDRAGYIFVYQDVRGKWMSEGDYVHVRPFLLAGSNPSDVDESTDAYDTIEWLLANIPQHNGAVGLWGISYPGFYAAGALINAHPSVKAVSPQAPIADWFIGDDWHRNGALCLSKNYKFKSASPSKETEAVQTNPSIDPVDGYAYYLKLNPLADVGKQLFKGDRKFYDDVMQHGNYDDFWKARDIRPHLKNIRPAVMTVGGWFDAEDLFGALEVYRQIEKSSPKTTNIIVMGPWCHGGWSRPDGSKLGDVTFGSNTAEFYREQIEFPFFEFHLKGIETESLPEAYMFETGTNVWRKHDVWPPQAAIRKSFYLREQGRLETNSPPTEAASVEYDEYQSNPNRPVPFIEKIAMGMPIEYMTADQRFASRRPDVLVYETDVLEHDLTIAGPINVELFVSTTGTDSDWVVKVIDVYPLNTPDPQPNPTGVKMGGYQQLVRGDVMRGKFRKSFEKPEPFTPNEPTQVTIEMPDVYHTFGKGHRLMVQIQSSWFPLIDRSPQRFMDIFSAKNSDFQLATQKVFHSKSMPSRIEVLVMPQAIAGKW